MYLVPLPNLKRHVTSSLRKIEKIDDFLRGAHTNDNTGNWLICLIHKMRKTTKYCHNRLANKCLSYNYATSWIKWVVYWRAKSALLSCSRPDTQACYCCFINLFTSSNLQDLICNDPFTPLTSVITNYASETVLWRSQYHILF